MPPLVPVHPLESLGLLCLRLFKQFLSCPRLPTLGRRVSLISQLLNSVVLVGEEITVVVALVYHLLAIWNVLADDFLTMFVNLRFNFDIVLDFKLSKLF